MAAGNAPQRLDLVICTRRMNHVIDVDAANLTITVEAGVKFGEIQARLAAEEDRCYFPTTDDTADFVCSDRGVCFTVCPAIWSWGYDLSRRAATSSEPAARPLKMYPDTISPN